MFKNRDGQPLVLASSSPRRRELLGGCGLDFKIESPDIDESALPGELPQAHVERLAREKGQAVASRTPGAWIVAADTIVVLDGVILGKPTDRADAARMLKAIQGRWHVVWGGIAILHKEKSIADVMSYSSEVLMRELSEDQIVRYIDTGEPLDKAGSYAIQGIGASLVKEIKGSYSNIVGLNINAVIETLAGRGAIG